MQTKSQLQVRTTVHALERLPRVMRRTGLSKSEIYRRMRAGSFPKAIALGPKTVAWSAAKIDRWISERVAEAEGNEN